MTYDESPSSHDSSSHDPNNWDYWDYMGHADRELFWSQLDEDQRARFWERLDDLDRKLFWGPDPQDWPDEEAERKARVARTIKRSEKEGGYYDPYTGEYYKDVYAAIDSLMP